MVPVPPDVRQAACALYIAHGQHGMVKRLRIPRIFHAKDLIAPGAIISAAVLDRVKARLAEQT